MSKEEAQIHLPPPVRENADCLNIKPGWHKDIVSTIKEDEEDYKNRKLKKPVENNQPVGYERYWEGNYWSQKTKGKKPEIKTATQQPETEKINPTATLKMLLITAALLIATILSTVKHLNEAMVAGLVFATVIAAIFTAGLATELAAQIKSKNLQNKLKNYPLYPKQTSGDIKLVEYLNIQKVATTWTIQITSNSVIISKLYAIKTPYVTTAWVINQKEIKNVSLKNKKITIETKNTKIKLILENKKVAKKIEKKLNQVTEQNEENQDQETTSNQHQKNPEQNETL